MGFSQYVGYLVKSKKFAITLLSISLLLLVTMHSVGLVPTRYDDYVEVAHVQPGRYFEIWLGTNHNITVFGINIGKYHTRTKVLAIVEGETIKDVRL